MAGPIITDFYDKLIETVNETSLRGRIERLWLGGTAGPSGGQGQRPGGFIGQLNQTLVSYDTDEFATIVGSGSLLDNLNHIRYNIAVVSGILSSGVSGTIAVQEVDENPTVSGVTLITFSGAVITNLGGGEVLVTIPSGNFILTIAEADGSPEVSGVTKVNFIGATVTDDGGGEVTVTVTASGTSSVETFLDLTDTPNNYTTFSGKYVAVKSTEDGLEFVDAPTGSGGGANTFLQLTDTPNTYTGEAGNFFVVNQTENGIEFGTDRVVITESGIAGYDSTYDLKFNLDTNNGSISAANEIVLINTSGIRLTQLEDTTTTRLSWYGTDPVQNLANIYAYATDAVGFDNAFLTIQALAPTVAASAAVSIQTIVSGNTTTLAVLEDVITVTDTFRPTIDNSASLGSTTIKWANIFGNALTLEERTAPPTPSSGDLVVYAKTDGKIYAKNDGGIEYDLTASGVAGAITFLDLTDTPDSYIGQAGKVPTVTFDETGLEFTTVSGLSGSGDEILIWIGV